VSLPDRAYPAYPLLGTWVNALTLGDILQIAHQAVSQGERHVIANHNLHSLYLYHHDVDMREFYSQASYIHADGMAIILLGRLLGLPLERQHRVSYGDLLRPLMSEAAEQGWRVFFLGSKPGVAARAADVLRFAHPGLAIETAHGYFEATPDHPENEAVRIRIATYQPHVLIVGMGMPRQEHWVLRERDQLEANVILTAGAAMDYVAGVLPTPPRWVGQIGLEWLYRLANNPRRLWRRYLLEPWFVLALLVRSSIRRGMAWRWRE
jgi:N-acetylglucosaminyldiphosphoundecaprenol N-acetyl-beta-D-mannosaminyltransferase